MLTEPPLSRAVSYIFFHVTACVMASLVHCKAESGLYIEISSELIVSGKYFESVVSNVK
jgi:hypothetical protein